MSSSDEKMPRDQFAARVTQIVRERFPLVKIEPGEAEFSLRVNGAEAPLENLYRVTAMYPEDLKHNVERWAVELLRAAEGTPDQGGSFEEMKHRILPMLLRCASGDDPQSPKEGLVTQPLVAGLMVAYAIDNDRTIAYISRNRFEQWGVPIETLHQTAIDNLVARSESIAAHAAQDESGNVNLILFQTMDGYDASRILLPTLHDRLKEHLGSPFAAGIPNRDILLCFRDDQETVARLGTQIAKDYRTMPHQVTDQLLLVTPDGLAPHPAGGS
jgi:uncharacterized protein YtpQ (UPF0354 family)